MKIWTWFKGLKKQAQVILIIIIAAVAYGVYKNIGG